MFSVSRVLTVHFYGCEFGRRKRSGRDEEGGYMFGLRFLRVLLGELTQFHIGM